MSNCEEVLKRIEPEVVTRGVAFVSAARPVPVRAVMERQRSFSYTAYRPIQVAYYVPERRPPGMQTLSGLGREIDLLDAPSSFGAVAEVTETDTDALVQLRAQANWAVSDLQGAYMRGAVRIGVATALSPAILTWAMGTGNVTSALLANYRTLGKRILQWSGTLRDDADRGFHVDAAQRPTGGYSWAKWTSFGKSLANEVNYQTSLAWNTNSFVATLNSVVETAKLLAPTTDGLLNPSNWPTWLKAVAGVVAVGAGLYTLNTLTRAKRTFLPGSAR